MFPVSGKQKRDTMKDMKPYDLLIALRLAIAPEDKRLRPTAWLAESLGLSTSRIHESLRRLHRVRIVDPHDNRVSTASLLEFVEHGLRYTYPVDLGVVTRGVPTASSAPPLAETFGEGPAESAFVWPDGLGQVRGASVAPLHPNVPAIALHDPRMHQLLALLDAARMDDPRIRAAGVTGLRDALKARVDV